MPLFEELQQRGLVHQVTDPELGKTLESDSLVFYLGFDPTAESLHVGQLLGLQLLRRLQRAGHPPIALVGGATGMIGDPGGKTEERKLLGTEVLARNVRGVSEQIRRLVEAGEGPPVRVLDNAQWLAAFSVLDFLREVGKHFTVNHMVAKESVRARLEDREGGISYTEFSYMLLQAADFAHLWRTYGCALQLGGSDQWGNITAGCELVRRTAATRGEPAPRVFGLTHPLITKADGTKFGKSESGTVWLDAQRTSPFEFYQFFLRTADKDAGQLLRWLTELPLEEIAELERASARAPEAREAQRALARELTHWVHGPAELERAEQTTASLYEPGARGSAAALRQAAAGAPASAVSLERLGKGLPLVDALVESGLLASKAAARREIQGGGIYVNGARSGDVAAQLTPADLIEGEFIVLGRGKRALHLLKVG